MSLGADDEDLANVGTVRGRGYPSIRQLSIFTPNQVGQLLDLTRRIESAQLRICALSVADSSECSIIRLVVTQVERAIEILHQAGFKFCEVDLLGVELPDCPQPILTICSALLQAEIDIHYCFPLLVRPHGRSALVLRVDDHATASRLLDSKGFVLLTEGDLEE